MNSFDKNIHDYWIYRYKYISRLKRIENSDLAACVSKYLNIPISNYKAKNAARKMEQKIDLAAEKEQECQQINDSNLSIDWLNLLLGIDLVSVRILEKFYRYESPECFVLGLLHGELKGLKISIDTVSRRCRWLQERGLLQIIKGTNPLVIWSVKGIEENVRRLIFRAYSRILGEKKWE